MHANFHRLATGLDIAPLLAAIDDNPQLWDLITIRQDYPGSAHKDTQCIFLRGPAAFTFAEFFGNTDAHDYRAMDTLSPAIVDLMRPVLDTMEATQLGYVLIVKLKPGGVITEHVDEGAYADHFQRFHLALISEPETTLTVGGETQHFAPGELWWFNHKAPHSGHNDSTQDRIHLIFDAIAPGFGSEVYVSPSAPDTLGV